MPPSAHTFTLIHPPRLPASTTPPATKTLFLLGAPVTAEDLKQRTNARRDTTLLRADLQTWSANALVRHRIFRNTFLFGVWAHESHTQTSHTEPLVTRVEPPNSLSVSLSAPITTSQMTARYFVAAGEHKGAKVEVTTTTTLTNAEMTTVTTTARTSNPNLPMLNVEAVLAKVRVVRNIYAAASTTSILRTTRALRPPTHSRSRSRTHTHPFFSLDRRIRRCGGGRRAAPRT